MAKKRKRALADQAEFDARTKMIEDYIARLDAKIEAKKAAETHPSS